MSFGTTKMVRTFKFGVHNFEVIEAVVKQNPLKGSAFLNLKSCVCIDAKGADKGREIQNQMLPFIFGLNFGPNGKKDGEAIRDTYYFLVSICGLDYLDFDDEEMEPAEALVKAYDALIENADNIADDIVGKTFKARTLNDEDRDGAPCSKFAKGSFASLVSVGGAVTEKKVVHQVVKPSSATNKVEAGKVGDKVQVDEDDYY